MRELGLINGRFVDMNEKVVTMEDRGHQFGDGVYEVTKVYNGKCFALRPHLDRLYQSLRAIRIPATYTFEELVQFHEALIKESGITEGAIYLQITRGAAPRVHPFPEQVVPCLTMSIRSSGPVKQELRDNGVKIILIPDERWLRCDIKSLNLLSNVLGKQQAKEAGCYEAVMVREGSVTEGTSSNFFVVKDGVIWTHPATNLILKGITRTILLERLAKELDLTILEKAFDVSFVKGASEAFLSGTSTEIMPVNSIDGKLVNDGVVGPITRKLQAAYTQLIDEECGWN
ncbi:MULTISPECIES: D-amino-acid transaminase [Pelosinus]|jgi:D-alanine transaminase|uniref:D-alanine aminotransferase n=1 Tax=Pelosinus fermentans B4 TaxID=1149862 RepID=I9LBY4_9FIRM|nr:MULTISPECIES: D-amino-acid transaminase [Pelosinus]EIW17929.1 D-amino acid aminotransferase [Pelosinus fermentans B4]EIW23891.1 D-amino acid aminotransferase [Pelosinus fermentans A11]OAM94814.1 D-amino acid aminotransferase [Pelosinus fermentans DSM 17108]SDR18182.1 D-alanine transaminase [Pelosinus fermentans]